MAQTTSNYHLVKPELKDAPPDVTVLNENFDTIDAELKEQADQLESKETVEGAQAKVAAHAKSISHVPHLGTTTNVGDAYSITTTEAIGDNQKFTVKFNAASTASPTLSINSGEAIPIKKPNGGNAKVYASVYTLFNDGSVFTLLGEGGEYGTATAADVVAGKTIGTENGLVTGTMVDRPAQQAALSTGEANSNVYARIPLGAYRTVANGGNAEVVIPYSMLADNEATKIDGSKMLQGTSYYGVDGAIPDRRNVTSDAVGRTLSGYDLYLNTPEGYYNSVSSIRVREDNLNNTANWRSDVTLFGRQGTMPVREAYTEPINAEWNGNHLFVRIPNGAYVNVGGTGYPEIRIPPEQARADGNIQAGNIRSGVWIYGVQGTLQPKYYASGTTYVSASDVAVSGIGFRPFGFALYMAPPMSHYYIFYFSCGRDYPFSGNGTASGNGYAADYYVNDDGFSAHSNYSQFGAGTYIWEAWG